MFLHFFVNLYVLHFCNGMAQNKTYNILHMMRLPNCQISNLIKAIIFFLKVCTIIFYVP